MKEISESNLKSRDWWADFIINLCKEEGNYFKHEHKFQEMLVHKLQESLPRTGAAVFMECAFPTVDRRGRLVRNCVDVVVYHNDKIYPIELKHNAWDGKDCVAGASDNNIQRCNFAEDIILTEKLLQLENVKIEQGYCIFLTNTETLYGGGDRTKHTKEFKLHDLKINAGDTWVYGGDNPDLFPREYKFQYSYEEQWSKPISKMETSADFKLLVVPIVRS